MQEKKTALYWAYVKGHLEVVETLRKHGANVEDLVRLLCVNGQHAVTQHGVSGLALTWFCTHD